MINEAKENRVAFDAADDGDTSSPNPYQPPIEPTDSIDLAAPTRVRYALTSRTLHRHAEAHYLLHHHSSRLLFGSLAMISISAAAIFRSVTFHLGTFLPTLIGVMLVSALVYSAMIHRTKIRIRKRQDRLGLSGNETMVLDVNSDELRLQTPEKTYRWKNEGIKIHKTKRGLLIRPEPFTYLFVPKASDFDLPSYRYFVKAMKLRFDPETSESRDRELG